MKEILTVLLDLQFTRMVTPKLAPLLYLLAIVGAAIGSIGMMFRMGFWGFLLGILWFVASVIFTRVTIEVALSVFQVAKYTQEMARQGRSVRASGAPAELLATPKT